MLMPQAMPMTGRRISSPTSRLRHRLRPISRLATLTMAPLALTERVGVRGPQARPSHLLVRPAQLSCRARDETGMGRRASFVDHASVTDEDDAVSPGGVGSVVGDEDRCASTVAMGA